MSRQRHPDATFGPTPFACPHCRRPLADGSSGCRDCGLEVEVRGGIPVFRPDLVDSIPGPLGADDLTALADRVERGSIREATAAVLADRDDRGDVLEQLFDVERDAWQALVAPHVRGRCLDVDPGFGRRPATLAERADVAYAVDANLSRLRIATARDDYDSVDRVRPVQTTEDLLPFSPGALETIVADCTGSSASAVRARVGRLAEYLAADGTVICTLDGWPRRAGLLGPRPESGRDLTGGTPARYRAALADAGFEEVSLYALVPSARRPLYAFPVDTDHAASVLASFVAAERGRLARLGVPLADLAARTGLLERLSPGLLAVCANEPRPAPFGVEDPLLVAGRARSTLLETGPKGVEDVWKLPNRRDHAPLTERENAVLAALRARDHPVAETLPAGEGVESPLGSARRERPVEGAELGSLLAGDRASYERVLRLGLDWLARFQNAFRGPADVRSPAAVRSDLRFEPAGIDPPAVDAPVETFTTPVHGDYLPGNVHVRDGAVSSVIDWEYGSLEANPIVDAGFFVLNTAARRFGDVETGLRTVFDEENGYADATAAAIRRYCDAVDLPTRTFALYLPIVYVYRLGIDREHDLATTYTETREEYVREAELASAYRPALE